MTHQERAERWLRLAASSTDVRLSEQPIGASSLAAEFAAVEAEARADEREKMQRQFKEFADSWTRFGQVGRALGESEKK